MRNLSSDLLESLNRAPNPVYVTDENSRVIVWNPAVEQLLGHPAAAAIGKKCYALIAGKDIYGNAFCDQECNVLKIVRRNRVVKCFDMDLRCASGELTRAHCAILVMPGPSSSRFSIVHLLQGAEEEPPSGRIRDRTSVPNESVQSPAPSGIRAQLTAREQQVLRMLVTGAGTGDIAESLYISPTTVRTHIRNLLNKLDAHNRLEAVLYALRDRLI